MYIGGGFSPNTTHFIVKPITQGIEIQMGLGEYFLCGRVMWLSDQHDQYVNGLRNSNCSPTASGEWVGHRTHRAGGSSNDTHDLDGGLSQ